MGIFHITPMHGNRKPLKMHALAAPGNRVFLILFFVLLPCILWSCAAQQKSVQKASPQDQSKATAKGELKELVLPQKGEIGAKPQKLYTLRMRDAEVQDLLLAFSREDTNLNVVVDPKVSGRFTVDLKGVTLEQALDVICSQLGVEYRREKNIITIYKPSLETRIFSLDYITTVRKGKSFATGGISGRSSGGGTSGGAGGSSASGQSRSAGYSEVSTEDESDLWKEIEKGLQSLKSTEGSVIVHKSSNTVLVKDSPASLQRIAGYLNSVTGSVQRQVLIETQIIEVSLNDTFQAGIDWQTIQNLPQMSNLSWGLAGKGTSPWVGYPGSTGTSGGSSSGGSSSGTTQEIPGKFYIRPYGGVFRIGAPDQNIPLSDIVDALSTQGNVNILSSPRISTLNNQPAIIKVAREEPYFQTTRTTVTGETNTTTEVNFLTIGIVLAVTPQISADGTITLTIHPSITERAGERVSAQGDVVPIVDVRETDTVVRVNDRETILIAGLMQNKMFEDINGIPLLRDIPLIGRLFTHISRETKKTELVVMLTPRVITSENVKKLSSPAIKSVDELRRDNFKNSK